MGDDRVPAYKIVTVESAFQVGDEIVLNFYGSKNGNSTIRKLRLVIPAESTMSQVRKNKSTDKIKFISEGSIQLKLVRRQVKRNWEISGTELEILNKAGSKRNDSSNLIPGILVEEQVLRGRMVDKLIWVAIPDNNKIFLIKVLPAYHGNPVVIALTWVILPFAVVADVVLFPITIPVGFQYQFRGFG